MTKKKVTTQIPVIFQDMKEYSNEDTRFLKIKIWLLHLGKNLNGSIFTKESVEKALPTLANTPILSFIEENNLGENDFSDHRIVLHRAEDGDISLKYLGSAVGTIPETNNAQWEMRVGDDGIEREYLTVEALMWRKWDDSVDIMKNRKITSQSMELSEKYSGVYDNEGYFTFEDFEFFGACLLGEDVMPAMLSSTAEIQFSKNEDIKNKIEDKLQEFYTLFSQKGGNTMTKENTPELEAVLAPEVTVIETEIAEDFTQTEEVELTNTPTDTQEDTATGSEKVEDEELVNDTEDATEGSVEAVEEAEEVVEVIDFESKFNELNETHSTLTAEYTALQSQLAELQSYKRKREEVDLENKFSGKLSSDEFTQLFTDSANLDLAVVEEKLYALIGKKNFSAQPKTKTNTNKLDIKMPEDTVSSPYGSMFD